MRTSGLLALPVQTEVSAVIRVLTVLDLILESRSNTEWLRLVTISSSGPTVEIKVNSNTIKTGNVVETGPDLQSCKKNWQCPASSSWATCSTSLTAVSEFNSRPRRYSCRQWQEHEAGAQQGVPGASPPSPEGLCPGGPHRAEGVPAGSRSMCWPVRLMALFRALTPSLLLRSESHFFPLMICSMPLITVSWSLLGNTGLCYGAWL